MRISRRQKDKSCTAGNSLTSELHYSEVPSSKYFKATWIFPDELPVKSPIFVAGNFDYLSLEIEFTRRTWAVKKQIKRNSAIIANGQFREGGIQLLNEHIGIQVDTLLVSRIQITEMPLEKTKVRGR